MHSMPAQKPQCVCPALASRAVRLDPETIHSRKRENLVGSKT
jgi:hypothetical protein